MVAKRKSKTSGDRYSETLSYLKQRMNHGAPKGPNFNGFVTELVKKKEVLLDIGDSYKKGPEIATYGDLVSAYAQLAGRYGGLTSGFELIKQFTLAEKTLENAYDAIGKYARTDVDKKTGYKTIIETAIKLIEHAQRRSDNDAGVRMQHQAISDIYELAQKCRIDLNRLLPKKKKRTTVKRKKH